MDITNALAPKSDQLDAVDLLGSPPRVFTITEVSEGNAEQPVNIRLAEFPRVWRPSKGMLRVLAHCWGKETQPWAGRRVELYCDPDVMFGKERVGGVRIKRLSHIEKRTSAPMIISKGRSGSWTVDPLPDAPAAPTEAIVATCTDQDQLRAWWHEYPHLRTSIGARGAELTQDAEPAAEPESGDQP